MWQKNIFYLRPKNRQNTVLYTRKTGSNMSLERITAVTSLYFLYLSVNELHQKEVTCCLTYTRSESDIEGVDACQSKVCNLDFSTAADQDVFWF